MVPEHSAATLLIKPTITLFSLNLFVTSRLNAQEVVSFCETLFGKPVQDQAVRFFWHLLLNPVPAG